MLIYPCRHRRCSAFGLSLSSTFDQVLLVPQDPTVDWKRLVLKFAANDRVTYLKGDLRSTADLNRISAHKASSCFILSNR